MKTDKPIDLDVERTARRDDPDYDGVFCSCGSAWFNACVVIDKTGCVTGYEWPPSCTSCGTPLESTR